MTARSILGALPKRLLAPALLAVSAAAALCGCTPLERSLTARPTTSDGPSDPGAVLKAVAGPAEATPMTVTAKQRDFLDGLVAAGVRPTNDLDALAIGSYICQAHAAGQSEQAVRDFVLPMVRSDLAEQSTHTVMAAQAESTTTAYMRTATDRLC